MKWSSTYHRIAKNLSIKPKYVLFLGWCACMCLCCRYIVENFHLLTTNKNKKLKSYTCISTYHAKGGSYSVLHWEHNYQTSLLFPLKRLLPIQDCNSSATIWLSFYVVSLVSSFDVYLLSTAISNRTNKGNNM